MNTILTGQFLLYLAVAVALVLAVLQINGQIEIVGPVQDFLSTGS